MPKYLSPLSFEQRTDSNGNPYASAKLFTYVAGTSTKVTTYKDSAGASSHANPIVLNVRGEPADGSGVAKPIFVDGGGALVKYVLAPSTDTDPPVSAISEWDNIPGINDQATAVAEWNPGTTPTYISATSFSVAGDQTSIYHVGRRVKTTNTAGTRYSTISVTAYTTLTTVTVVNDSGTLDSGLSAVEYGTMSAVNTSFPGSVTSSNNTFSGVTLTAVATVSGHTKFSNGILGAGYTNNVALSGSVAASALTIALKGKDGNDPSATNPVEIAFRNSTAATGDYTILTLTSAYSIVVPSTATLGTASAYPSRVWVVGFNDGGTFRLGVINCCDPLIGIGSFVYTISDDRLVSSTAIAVSSDSASIFYTGSAVTVKAMRILGFVDSTQTTAGTWATSPSNVVIWTQGMKLPGDVVRSAYDTFYGIDTTASLIPDDDTIPQSTEGGEFMGITFNSLYSHTVLNIRAHAMLANTAAGAVVTAALFSSNGATYTPDAFAATQFRFPAANGQFPIDVQHQVHVAKFAGDTTFWLRAGCAAAGTTTLNGSAGARKLGGVLNSYIKIEEIMV